MALMTISIMCTSQKDADISIETYFAAIIVGDIDASIDWYTNMLGFEVIDRIENNERGFSNQISDEKAF